MRHKTQMVTAAPASPSTDSDHTACPIDSDHSATDSDRTVPATPSSVTQAFTETSEPEDVSEVEVDIEDESSLKAVVTFRGEKAWHNCEELKHRPVRADESDALANALTSKLPRSVYLDKLNKLDDTVLASGNRDQSSWSPWPIISVESASRNLEDEVVTSAVVVFSSSHSDRNVGKHFENLQGLLTNSAQSNLDDSTIVEDCVNDIGPTTFKQHFEDLITQTVIEKSADDNMYFCPTFIPSLLKYFLPLAGLWSGLLLGDLGRHGTGTIYQKLSQKYKNAAKKPTQNYTEDNKTQGIMEKSQWDLKKIRFQRRRLTRLDDFVHTYKVTLSALLREYGDSLRRGKKTHRVDMERWKKRKQNRRGVYVTPINKPFVFRQHKKNLMQKTKTAKAPAPLQKQEPGETEAHIPSQDPKDKARQGQSSSTSEMTEHAEDDAQGGKVDASSELTALWKKKDTEVVVSVVPTQIRGNSFTIRHSDMRTLRPHQWLTGEIIECLFHIHAHKCERGTRIYILNHYSAGVILFGKREEVRKHTLSKIHFDSYGAIVSFVHVDGVHWTFLHINAEESTVYLADPARSSAEQAESDNAANKFSDYFKMRRTCCSKTDWVAIKWKGGVMKHPVQQDGNSCGVVVCMMAKEVMEVISV
ncbi:hypothetical protein JOQ06_008356 [Pogonophryne albipinna]|uniref:Ubiquitin-like protease family profile domain-containing protein n=1 Tax=Pogonophryne albipinna TaxID=1090488 RepID=A0AAD6FA84_9TELE|nr:hypothetical protein JOQ06_008356 [Pogonophryne albipinna]